MPCQVVLALFQATTKFNALTYTADFVKLSWLIKENLECNGYWNDLQFVSF